MKGDGVPLDPDLTRPLAAPIDPDTGEPLDCTTCGACCRAGEGSMLLVDEDLARWRGAGRPDLAARTAPGHFGLRAFPTTAEGACVHLTTPEGRAICSIYELRADVCRQFQAGSWQCLEFRREQRRQGLVP